MQRTEKDFLGEITLDNQLYYGIQTVRGMQLSHATGHSIGQEAPELIFYLAAIKKAAAMANLQQGNLEPAMAQGIRQACDEVMAGHLFEHFPIDLLTGGGGISVNMNVNEVLAHRACECMGRLREDGLVHPNTHVNMGQSTNDVYPAAILLTLHQLLLELADVTEALADTLSRKETEFEAVVKLGRTCLQDALPLTLGQEFSGYTCFVKRQATLLRRLSQDCLVLPLGATAVGTGAGASLPFVEAWYQELRGLTGLNIQRAENYFDAMQNGDLYLRISALLKSLSCGLSKMATDFRLLSSGPRSGFRELQLPAVTPGSSIMPGKINPVLPELINQIYFQICGNDVAVTLAVEAAELDLNVWESSILKSLLESFRLLTRSIPVFDQKCVAGITSNPEVCSESARRSTAMASVVASVFGYEQGCHVAREALQHNETIAEAVIRQGLLSRETAQALLDPMTMTDTLVLEEQIQNARKQRNNEKT